MSSSAAIIAIAIAVVVVLGGDRSASPQRDAATCAAQGALVAETRKRDEAAGRSTCRRARHRRRGRAGRASERPTAARRPRRWSGAAAGAVGSSARSRGRSASPAGSSSTAPWSRSWPPASAGFAAAGFVAFLWPTASGGFGRKVNVGKLDDINDGHRQRAAVLLRADGRFLDHRLPVGRPAQGGGASYPGRRPRRHGRRASSALYQKCPHLGCRVPSCTSQQWFECPCHGSQYNQVGEKKAGPAPRGMDRFAITVDAGGDVIDRHRHRVSPGRRSARTPPARRPRDRTASPERQALMTRMAGAQPRPPSRGSSSRSSVVGFIIYAVVNRRPARKELGSEIELAPNRKPYYDDEELEGKRLERVPARRRAAARRHRRSACRSTGCSSRPARPAPRSRPRQPLRRRGATSCSRPTADGGFNCAGCHGGMNATGGNAPYAVTDPATGEVAGGHLASPRRSTPCCYRFSADEVRYILTYGRPGSPMSAWGLDGGGPMNDQQIDNAHRLPRTDPDPREDCADRRGRRPELPDRPPAERAPAGDRDARPTAPSTSGEARQLRRSAVQPRPRQRGVQLRPLPHAGVELRRSRRAAARARLGWNLTGGATNAPLPAGIRHDRLRLRGLRERRRLRPRRPRQRPHARLRRLLTDRADPSRSSSTCGACDVHATFAARSPSAGSPSSAASSSSSSPSACCAARCT